MKNTNQHNWYLPIIKPTPNKPVVFERKEMNNESKPVEFCGEYIPHEDMFYIGFEDTGFFLFSSQIKRWRYC
jgi:hypothetical protein